MICLALGLGALGFFALRHARRCGRGYHGYYGCGGYGYGHYGHWHGRGGFGRRGLFMGLAHLDASPAQERAIIAEVDKLTERLHGAKANLREGRGDLAAAIRNAQLDDAALGALLGRVDAATGEARTAVVEALRNIHGVLDDRQRERLADLLDKGWWRRGGGPYRV
ncbi:MAG TPA: periplasmic heavy metal sensor [Kofleriaceae bacterium]|nr:periplasmic heavy metal sensor [Kofleriaceae bacterium]